MMSHTRTTTFILKLEVELQLLIHVDHAIGKKAQKHDMLMQNGCENIQNKCVLDYLILTRTEDLSYVVS